jgi:hypothetical protein
MLADNKNMRQLIQLYNLCIMSTGPFQIGQGKSPKQV